GAGTKETCLRRGNTKAERLGSFHDREPGNCAQSKCLAQRSRKPGSRLTEHLTHFPALHEVLWGRLRIASHNRRQPRIGIIQTDETPPTIRLPEMHQAMINYNPRYPCL